ncbi:hypothetical protein ACFLQK_01100 [bacterium]
MKIRRGWLIAAQVVLVMMAFHVSAAANTTSYWTQAGIERFYHGQFFGTALTQDGRVTLGFKMEEALKSTEPYFWSMVYDSRGTLWAGSGNKAILFKVKKVGEPEEAAVLPGMGITALAVDAKNNVYAAVMPGAKIFKIDYKGDKEEFAMLPATYIWDMEFDDRGNLFCVTGVSAGAFEIKPDGTVIPLYGGSESHFLSMFLDGKGNLYTGTGQSGLILKINIGEAENFSGGPMKGMIRPGQPGWTHPPIGPGAESAEEETMEIEPADEGEETAETEDAEEAADAEEVATGETVPEAPTDPRVTVILDMEEDEAYRMLLLPDGNFLVAANRNQSAPPNPQKPHAISRNEPLSFPIGQSLMKQNKPAVPARVYLVTPEGRQRLILEVPDPYIMALHSLGGDDIIVGTGNEGRIYTMNVKTEEAMLQSLPVKNVLSIAGSGPSLRLGTGNPGALYKPAGGSVEQGQYLSSVNDAVTTAFYGNMDAVAVVSDGGTLEFQTRTGNTPDPMDGTWSEWSAPGTEWPMAIESPPGRYIQYMATLKLSESGEAPRLSEARFYYITDNQAPEIRKLQVLPQPEQRPPPGQSQNSNPPGPPSPNGGGPPQNNVPPPPQGPPEKNMIVGTVTVSNVITFRWQAEDPDSDTLRYKLEFRKMPAQGWVEIDDRLYGVEYKWQTESFPDGTYEARLSVTDEDSNTPERALADDIVSDPFIIDHTRPGIKVEKVESIKRGGKFRISAIASDPTSIISSVEYSLNDLEWRLVFPEDMIFDSTTEKVVFTIEEPDEGDNTALIRAKDFVGNTGSVSVPLVK